MREGEREERKGGERREGGRVRSFIMGTQFLQKIKQILNISCERFAVVSECGKTYNTNYLVKLIANIP